MKLGITFGALSPTIKKQLATQGFGAGRAHIAMWQRNADAIATLSILGLLADSETRNARRRLMNKIAAVVKERREG